MFNEYHLYRSWRWINTIYRYFRNSIPIINGWWSPIHLSWFIKKQLVPTKSYSTTPVLTHYMALSYAVIRSYSFENDVEYCLSVFWKCRSQFCFKALASFGICTIKIIRTLLMRYFHHYYLSHTINKHYFSHCSKVLNHIIQNLLKYILLAYIIS